MEDQDGRKRKGRPLTLGVYDLEKNIQGLQGLRDPRQKKKNEEGQIKDRKQT